MMTWFQLVDVNEIWMVVLKVIRSEITIPTKETKTLTQFEKKRNHNADTRFCQRWKDIAQSFSSSIRRTNLTLCDHSRLMSFFFFCLFHLGTSSIPTEILAQLLSFLKRASLAQRNIGNVSLSSSYGVSSSTSTSVEGPRFCFFLGEPVLPLVLLATMAHYPSLAWCSDHPHLDDQCPARPPRSHDVHIQVAA